MVAKHVDMLMADGEVRRYRDATPGIFERLGHMSEAFDLSPLSKFIGKEAGWEPIFGCIKSWSVRYRGPDGQWKFASGSGRLPDRFTVNTQEQSPIDKALDDKIREFESGRKRLRDGPGRPMSSKEWEETDRREIKATEDARRAVANSEALGNAMSKLPPHIAALQDRGTPMCRGGW